MNLRYEASGLVQGGYSYLRAHIDALTHLPEPDREWTRFDVADDVRPHLQKLISDGAIRIVGEEDGYKLYSTTDTAFEIVQDIDGNRTKLLCGHSGLKNLGDGLLTCSYEGCDHRYTKDTMTILLDPDDDHQ